MFGSKFISQYIIDVVMATSIQRCNCNIKFTTSSRRRYFDVVPAMRQLCEEKKRWAIHYHMVTFPQVFLKGEEKFNKDTAFVRYSRTILSH